MDSCSMRPPWAWLMAVACFAHADAFAPAGTGAFARRSGFANSARTASLNLPRMAGEEAYGEFRTQVITDIDDTVKSSGGVRLLWKVGPALGGIDTQFKRGAFYPGVFAFGAELASNALPPNMAPAPMAVLTARARELKVFLALKPTTKLCVAYNDAAQKLFDEWGIGSLPAPFLV
ncbi:hypothetical protein T484DRAFT_3097981 [Baffinella frigidus]|nr:hypothetical protein T484DRAFT_3097981 [Cryptophyta sp. CCMP2293]